MLKIIYRFCRNISDLIYILQFCSFLTRQTHRLSECNRFTFCIIHLLLVDSNFLEDVTFIEDDEDDDDDHKSHRSSNNVLPLGDNCIKECSSVKLKFDYGLNDILWILYTHLATKI